MVAAAIPAVTHADSNTPAGTDRLEKIENPLVCAGDLPPPARS
jgi:hypothetical protein